MGNCYENDTQALLKTIENDQQARIKKLKTHRVVEQVTYLPAIGKKIMAQLDTMKPFFQENTPNDFKVYRMEGEAYYTGGLKQVQGSKVYDGPGRLVLADGTLIESNFKQGKPNSRTRIFKPNGDYFVGELSNQEGGSHGVVVQNGIRYQGGVYNNKPHGQGEELAAKYRFKGTYRYGKKIRGKLQWNIHKPNEICSYEGPFENNEFSGTGVMMDGQGQYRGSFSNGKRHGNGELLLPSGKRIIGKFEQGKHLPDTKTPQGSGLNNEKPANYMNKSGIRK